MATTSIRVRTDVQETLKTISDAQQKSIGDVVADMVQRYETEQFWREAQAGYERLRADPEAWAEWEAEIAAWDATLMDGLAEQDVWTEGGNHDEDAGNEFRGPARTAARRGVGRISRSRRWS